MIVNRINILSLLLISTLFLFSCRKDTNSNIETLFEQTNCDYESYSTSEFYHLYDSFPPQIAPGDPTELVRGFEFHNPVFNPNNSCEIIYAKDINSTYSSYREIWKFNFDTGESSIIINDYYYSLDWGSNGWILYTANDNNVYKIKENGDSLTQLTSQSGGYGSGKWNPSGTLFWNFNNGVDYINAEGLIVYHHNFSPMFLFDWINDSTLIGIKNNKLYSMILPDEDITLLNSQYIDHNQSDKIYDKDNNLLYSTQWSINEFGEEVVNYISYSLDGTNTTDIIKPLYGKYFYNYTDGGKYDGDVQDGKIIITLQRGDWPDLTVNEIYSNYEY